MRCTISFERFNDDFFPISKHTQKFIFQVELIYKAYIWIFRFIHILWNFVIFCIESIFLIDIIIV